MSLPPSPPYPKAPEVLRGCAGEAVKGGGGTVGSATFIRAVPLSFYTLGLSEQKSSAAKKKNPKKP